MTSPAKTREVFEYLKECAGQMRTVAYNEVATTVGLAASGVGMGRPLEYIREHVCRPRGLPWLIAIAVSKETWRPSGGFLPDDVSVASDVKERVWRGMVLEVFAYDWKGVNWEEESVSQHS